jgi:parallel beta-helix repeat protein
MMKVIEKIGLALLAIGCLGFVLPGLEAATTRVNCNKGQSVQSALNSLTGPATIEVTGTCRENVVIKKDDVSLQGGTYIAFDPARETILVQGARRVAITSVTVTGGLNGVVAYQGGSLTLENSLIEANAGKGVVAVYGSSVTVNSCTIQDNTQQGVLVNDNSALVLTNSTITDNNSAGVLVQRTSSARIGQSMAGVHGLNTITNNGGAGVSVCRSAYALIDGNTITGNSANGISIEGASATVTNNTILENHKKGIDVSSAGNARIGITEGNQPGPNTIENNFFEGIEISNSGAAYVFANTIRNNGQSTYRAGVAISRATGRLLGDNTIQENGGHGVAVKLGALFQGKGDVSDITPGPDIIIENGYSGIFAWNGASLDIQNVEVTGNHENGIFLGLHSTLQIYGSTVSNNLFHGIAVYDGSAASFDHPTGNPAVIVGNVGDAVFCNDSESSYTGDTDGVTGKIKCTGF